jgi:hypothetical protein
MKGVHAFLLSTRATRGSSGAGGEPKMPNPGVFLVVLCMICAGVGGEAGAQQTQAATAFAKVCVSVFGDLTRDEKAFDAEQEPGPGKSVVVHAVASAPCILLVAALNQSNGQLAHEWRPQYRILSEPWEEVTIPDNAGLWQWAKQGEPFYFYVLALAPGSPLASDIQRLVDAMQQNGRPVAVLTMQTNKLRELITQAAGDSDPTKHRATAAPVEVHGVTRGTTEFLWRNFASSVHFDNRSSGLLMFQGGS